MHGSLESLMPRHNLRMLEYELGQFEHWVGVAEPEILWTSPQMCLAPDAKLVRQAWT